MTSECDDLPLPGRVIPDSERSAFGLGWEYRRRGLDQGRCPLLGAVLRKAFSDGHNAFVSSGTETNNAMLGKTNGNT